MTLGLLRSMTSYDLQHYYGIQGELQEKLLKVIEESRGEDHSDMEVSEGEGRGGVGCITEMLCQLIHRL